MAELEYKQRKILRI